MPRSVPNYLTVDPTTGAVGASFTGHIAATGIDFSSVPYPNPADSITWTRKSDGAFLASVYSDNHQDINLATPHSSVTLTDDLGGPNVKSALRAFIGDNHTGGPQFVNILDSDGQSSFLKWDSSVNNDMKARSLGFTIGPIPSGAEVQTSFSVPWLTAVVMCGGLAGGATGSASAMLCTWSYFPNTPGNILVIIRNNSPFGMASGATWLGIAFYV